MVTVEEAIAIVEESVHYGSKKWIMIGGEEYPNFYALGVAPFDWDDDPYNQIKVICTLSQKRNIT